VSSVPSTGYRRLALATGVATFLLIIVGGIVRVSDSGLGCGPGGSGFHGWPFCNGDVVPGLDLNHIIEYTHRALAGVVGILIVALAVQAWRHNRSNRPLVWVTCGLVLLVLAQAGLGGATVEENLEEALVAAHLGLAMLLLGGLLWVWRSTRPDVIGAEPPSGGARFRPLAVATSVLVLCTIVAGGYMAGTQKYGRPDYQLGDGAHHACGKEFPTCNGDFMPFGQARLVDIHLTHRAFMYVASILILSLFAAVMWQRRRRAGGIEPALVGAAGASVAVLFGQVLLGALNVWLGEHEWLIVAHLSVGTLLWCSLVLVSLLALRAPQRSTVRARGDANVQVVPA
jgi:heme A synthase